MRLNVDAVREVLLYVENNINYKNGFVHDKYITHRDIVKGIEETSEYTKDDIRYAIEILLTTSFFDYAELPKRNLATGDLFSVRIRGLTFEGCNFLEDIRKPEIWETVKKLAKSGGKFSITSLAKAATYVANLYLTNPDAMMRLLSQSETLKEFVITGGRPQIPL